MGRGRKASAIELSEDERDVLQRLVRRRKVARGDALRAEIILRAANGLNNCAIADAVGATRQTVRTWRERFAKHRLDGLDDEPRCGAPRKIGDDRIEEIVTRTLENKPEDATHWSTRGMARASGVSASTVHRIWRAFSLQPHRTETFKLSTDPQFVEKVRDIVGLYLDPPEKALVICVDEKSQIQALDRTQPLLPMRPGQVERRTHDYDRHGTTTLFAGLFAAVTAETKIKAGTVIGTCMPRHRAQEFRKFLDEEKIPFTEQDLVDNNDWIRYSIKSEIFVDQFGQDEGLKIRAENDPQIIKALELLPKARALADHAKEVIAQHNNGRAIPQ